MLFNSVQVNPTPSLVDGASLPAPPPCHVDEVSSSSPQVGGDNPLTPPPPPMGGNSLSTSTKPVHGESSLASSSVGGAPSASHLVIGTSASTPGQSEHVEENKAYARQPWSGRCG